MKKRFFFSSLLGLISPMTLLAQGYLQDATTGNAVLTRDPACQASMEIDAVVTNPAGIMFLDNGFHASLSGIYSYREIEAKSVESPMNIFHNKETRILPAVQLAYKKDRWAVSASFHSSGFGKRKMKDGSLMANEYLNTEFADKLNEINDFFQLKNSTLELLALLDGQLSYISSEDKMAFFSKDVNTSLYNWTMSLGSAFKITENLSVYAGVKANHVVSNANTKYLFNIYRPSTGEKWDAASYQQRTFQTIEQLDIDTETKEELKDLYGLELDAFEALSTASGKIKEIDGWGFAPVLGIDYKLDKFNFGAKYEFASHINTRHSRNHFNVPSVLSAGMSWQKTKRLRLAAGGNIVFATGHNAFSTNEISEAFDLSASCTYNITDKVLISGGYTYSYEQQLVSEYFLNALPAMYNHRLSLGTAYSPMEKMQINLGLCMDLGTADSPVNMNIIAPSAQYNVKSFYDNKSRVQVALGINYSL